MLNTEKAAVAEIKARGQLTIPKKIREMRHLEEGQVVTIIPVGDVLIVAPKRLILEVLSLRLPEKHSRGGLHCDRAGRG